MQLDEDATTTGAEHPETSFAAARHALGRTGTGRRRVMQAIANSGAGLTDEAVQVLLSMSPNSQRPRRVELARFGLVADSGLRQRTLSGAPSIVWAATALGRRVLACAPD